MQRDSEKCLEILTGKPKFLRDACNCLTTQHRGNQTRPEEEINLFSCISTEGNASLFLGPRNEIRLFRAYNVSWYLEDNLQLVVGGKEWDRKSGTEVEEGLDGERDLLVVVEWYVLHYTFVSFPPEKLGSLRERRALYSPCMPRD